MLISYSLDRHAPQRIWIRHEYSPSCRHGVKPTTDSLLNESVQNVKTTKFFSYEKLEWGGQKRFWIRDFPILYPPILSLSPELMTSPLS